MTSEHTHRPVPLLIVALAAIALALAWGDAPSTSVAVHAQQPPAQRVLAPPSLPAVVAPSARPVNPADIQVPPGYTVEAVATGLTYATDVAFDHAGNVYIAEAGGHTYGTEPSQAPPARIVRLTPGGGTEIIFDDNIPLDVIRDTDCGEFPPGLIGPITGLTWHDGLLYITHRTMVSTLDVQTGAFRTIINCLPAWGEFQNNKVIFGPDGKMYFFVSTQGNSGPIGDHMLKVLTSYNKPDKSEIPCEDVTLTGQNFKWPNPFTADPNDFEIYGVYVPYGVFTPPGTVISGQIPCNGAFFKADPDGSNLELVAWGLRSNFGYRFTSDGRLITTMNSGNPIPPREIFDDWETIWEVEPGAWYGWPDFFSGLPVTDPRFQSPNEPGISQFQPLDFVLTPETHQRLLRGRTEPIQPLARIEPHYAIQGFVFGRPEFGVPEDDLLVAAFGTVVTYLADELPGFEVIRVNLAEGGHSDFLRNKSGLPASVTGGGGLERPIQLAWGPEGSLYIVDFGVIEVTQFGLDAEPNTGVLWRLRRAP